MPATGSRATLRQVPARQRVVGQQAGEHRVRRFERAGQPHATRASAAMDRRAARRRSESTRRAPTARCGSRRPAPPRRGGVARAAARPRPDAREAARRRPAAGPPRRTALRGNSAASTLPMRVTNAAQSAESVLVAARRGKRAKAARGRRAHARGAFDEAFFAFRLGLGRDRPGIDGEQLRQVRDAQERDVRQAEQVTDAAATSIDRPEWAAGPFQAARSRKPARVERSVKSGHGLPTRTT